MSKIINLLKTELETKLCWSQFFEGLIDTNCRNIVKYSHQQRYTLLKFYKDEAIEHFQKHGHSIMQVLGVSSYGIKEYWLDANNIIKTGTYIPELNAYVQIVGGKGRDAKFAFVGIDRFHNRITTFHIKDIKEIRRKTDMYF